MVKSSLEQRIIDALEPAAATHGIDVIDVEVTGATKAPCIRIRLDNLDGTPISLDEVTAQNAWVNKLVEDLDPIAGPYTLEVSSPGMARPLRRPADFKRFEGEAVELTTTATEGRRKFKGSIQAATDTEVTLTLNDGTDIQTTIPYSEIKKCVLKPVYDFTPKKEGK